MKNYRLFKLDNDLWLRNEDRLTYPFQKSGLIGGSMPIISPGFDRLSLRVMACWVSLFPPRGREAQ